MSPESAPSAAVHRVVAWLRSRRLAVWLLCGTIAYAVLVGILKVPRPYSNPLFVLVVAMLTASTVACAWERTRGAARAVGRIRAGGWSRRVVVVGASFAVVVGDGVSSDAALGAAEAGFRTCGLTCRTSTGGVRCTANIFGFWGSPIFHWALAGLFILAGVGQLSRGEGFVNVVAGSKTTDVAESYASATAGPLFFGRHTRLDIGVRSIASEHVAGGAERGASPLVEVSGGDELLVRTYVYPNHPARVGPLTIHRDATGPALLVHFRFPNGQEATTPAFFPEIVEGQPYERSELSVSNADIGTDYVVEFVPTQGRRVVIRIKDSDFASKPLGAGGVVRLPDGTRLEIIEFTSYARLRVVNDRTLPLLFAVFAIVAVGPAISLLWPPRSAFAVVDGEPPTLYVRVTQRRSDPAFRERVEMAVRDRIANIAETEGTT